MVGNLGNGRRQRGSFWRIAGWSIAALILLAPAVAMQFNDETNWGLGDFILAGTLLLGTGLTIELVARKSSHFAYRTAAGLSLVAALMLVWVNLAVGIIGSEGEPANLMYFGVLAIGIAGAFLARFQPLGLARALFATAIAQALVAVIALVSGAGSAGPKWPMDLLAMTAVFVTLFIVSALLFRKAAQE